MAKNNVFNSSKSKLERETLELYKSLSMVRGKNDISTYFKRVKEYYVSLIKEIYERLGIASFVGDNYFNNLLSEKSVQKLEEAIEVAEALQKLYESISKLVFDNNKGLTPLCGSFKRGETITIEKIKAVTNKLKGLQNGSGERKNSLINNPLLILYSTQAQYIGSPLEIYGTVTSDQDFLSRAGGSGKNILKAIGSYEKNPKYHGGRDAATPFLKNDVFYISQKTLDEYYYRAISARVTLMVSTRRRSVFFGSILWLIASAGLFFAFFFLFKTGLMLGELNELIRNLIICVSFVVVPFISILLLALLNVNRNSSPSNPFLYLCPRLTAPVLLVVFGILTCASTAFEVQDGAIGGMFMWLCFEVAILIFGSEIFTFVGGAGRHGFRLFNGSSALLYIGFIFLFRLFINSLDSIFFISMYIIYAVTIVGTFYVQYSVTHDEIEPSWNIRALLIWFGSMMALMVSVPFMFAPASWWHIDTMQSFWPNFGIIVGFYVVAIVICVLISYLFDESIIDVDLSRISQSFLPLFLGSFLSIFLFLRCVISPTGAFVTYVGPMAILTIGMFIASLILDIKGLTTILDEEEEMYRSPAIQLIFVGGLTLFYYLMPSLHIVAAYFAVIPFVGTMVVVSSVIAADEFI